jgi:hypothetical protein
MSGWLAMESRRTKVFLVVVVAAAAAAVIATAVAAAATAVAAALAATARVQRAAFSGRRSAEAGSLPYILPQRGPGAQYAPAAIFLLALQKLAQKHGRMALFARAIHALDRSACNIA